MKILFTGGGTGGHTVPIIAICREIRKIYPGKELEFVFLGPKDEFGLEFFAKEGIKVKHILSGKIRRYFSITSIFHNLIDIFIKLPLGIIQAFFYIFILSPDVIFSKGGYGSLPGVIAGKILFVPIFLHESDIVPGFSNKILGELAVEIFVSFPRTEHFPIKKILVVGNPTRKTLLGGSKEKAKELFNLTSEKPVILIMGGSQGAQRINEKVIRILPELLRDFEVIHQCGKQNFKQAETEAKIMISKKFEKYYHLFPFLEEEELRQAFAASDLVVGRAGSGTIFEIAAVGKPSILIPLSEAAQNHQIKNAYFYAAAGACEVIEEINFLPHFFFEKIKHLFSHPKELKKMSEKASEFSRPKAANIIANYLVDYLTK